MAAVNGCDEYPQPSSHAYSVLGTSTPSRRIVWPSPLTKWLPEIAIDKAGLAFAGPVTAPAKKQAVITTPTASMSRCVKDHADLYRRSPLPLFTGKCLDQWCQPVNVREG